MPVAVLMRSSLEISFRNLVEESACLYDDLY